MLSDKVRKALEYRNEHKSIVDELTAEVVQLEEALKTVLPYISHPDVQAIPFALPASNIERMIRGVIDNAS